MNPLKVKRNESGGRIPTLSPLAQLREYTGGNCASYAIALRNTIGKGEVYGFKDQDEGDYAHVFLKVGDKYYDVEGEQSIESMKRQWRIEQDIVLSTSSFENLSHLPDEQILASVGYDERSNTEQVKKFEKIFADIRKAPAGVTIKTGPRGGTFYISPRTGTKVYTH